MSKREKTLLSILIAIVIPFACIMLLIVPAFNALAENKVQHEEIMAEKTKTEDKLLGESLLKTRFDTAEKNLDKKSSIFIELMPNDDADQTITTKLMLENRLSIKSVTLADQTFSTARGKDVIAYSDTDKTPAIIKKVEATINSESENIESLRSFIDAIKEMDHVRIIKVTHTPADRSRTAVRNQEVGLDTVNLVVEITMQEDKDSALAKVDFEERIEELKLAQNITVATQ